MLKVCSKQCNECLFSKNRIVSSQRMAEILEGCKKKDTHFNCHKGTLVDQDVVCKGFFDTQTSQMIRIAGRLNMIKEVDPETLDDKNT